MKFLMGVFLFLHSIQTWALTHSVYADDNSFGAVVFLRNEAVDEAGEPVPGYCNGTFIAEDLIITAAHCVAQAQALGKTETVLEIGFYKYIEKPNGEKVRIGYKVIHQETQVPRFRFLPSVAEKIKRNGVKASILPGEDVAVIVLSKKVNLTAFNYKPVSLVQPSEWAGLQKNVLSYLPSVVTVNPLAEIATNDTKRKATLDNLKASGKNLESKSVSRVEPGDSGSPLFVRIGNEWKLLAITKGMAKSFFGSWDMFTVVPGNMP